MIIQNNDNTILKGRKTELAIEFCTLINSLVVMKKTFTSDQIREFVEVSVLEDGEKASDEIVKVVHKMQVKDFENFIHQALENFMDNKEE